MTKREIIERLSKKGVDPNMDLVSKLESIHNQQDFDNFEKELSGANLSNNIEYEYYNTAYFILYGQESDSYIG